MRTADLRARAGAAIPASGVNTGLRVSALHKRFGETSVLSGFDLEVEGGELVALLGANGSGKSTALRCVMGLTVPDSGTIELDGIEIGLSPGASRQRGGPHGERQRMAMIFQKVHLVPRRSVLDNVCAGALARIPVGRSLVPGLFPRAVTEEAMACLDRVGLADRAFARAGSLSGGQQQRVAVARALCQRATVILADEPVSALDPRAAEQVMHLLADLAATEKLAVAAVLHQPDLARRFAHRVIGLLRGRVVFDEVPAKLADDVLAGLYAPEAA